MKNLSLDLLVLNKWMQEEEEDVPHTMTTNRMIDALATLVDALVEKQGIYADEARWGWYKKPEENA